MEVAGLVHHPYIYNKVATETLGVVGEEAVRMPRPTPILGVAAFNGRSAPLQTYGFNAASPMAGSPKPPRMQRETKRVYISQL